MKRDALKNQRHPFSPNAESVRSNEAFDRPLKETMKVEIDASELSSLLTKTRERMESRREKQSFWRLKSAWVYASAATACLAIVLFATISWWSNQNLGKQATGPLQMADGSAPLTFSAGSEDSREYVFDERSKVQVSPGSELQTVANDARNFQVELREGSALFNVVPHGPRRWTVLCDGVIVSVLGTVFRVEKKAEGVSVSVTRGLVEVSGMNVQRGRVALRAGDQTFVRNAESANPTRMAQTVQQAPTQTSDHAQKTLPSSISARSTPTSVFSSAGNNRSPRASNGRAQEPSARIAETSSESLAPEQASAEERSDTEGVPVERSFAETMQEIDRLRAQGQSQEAATLLQANLPRFYGQQRALMALSWLRLEQDVLRDAALAEEAFRATQVANLNASLREEVLWRGIRAAQQLHRTADLRDRAQLYIRNFPHGRHRDEASQLFQESLH